MTDAKDVDEIEAAVVVARAHTVAAERLGVSFPESQRNYNEWALIYDKTLETLGRTAHVSTAEYVVQSFPPETRDSIRILDVGAGTGMVGQELKQMGFVHVDALEPNEAMLSLARARGVYENCITDYLTERETSLPADSYDAITGCGIFAESAHVPCEALYEMIRIVKPGGYIVLTTRTSVLEKTGEGSRLETVMRQIEASKLWKKIARDHLPDYNIHCGTEGIIWKYQVN